MLNASVSSPLWKLPVIDTVPLASVLLALSVTLTLPSTATGVEVALSPAVKAELPPLVVSNGASLIASITLAAVLVPPRPSLTVTCTVRVAVLGVPAVSLKVSALTSVPTRDAVALLLKSTIRSWPPLPTPLLSMVPTATPPTDTVLPELVPLLSVTVPAVLMPSTSSPLWPLAEMCTVRLPPLKFEVSLSLTVAAVPVSRLTAPLPA